MNPSLYTPEDFSLRRKIVKALRLAIDPELGINIVDMGLIYDIISDDQQKSIGVAMTLSSRGCPMGAAISGSAENVLASRFPGYRITIDLIWEPSWNYKFISPSGQLELQS